MRFAPLLLIALVAATPAAPQPPRPAQPAPAPNIPVPDQHTSLRLLWSIMAAVDQANRTGNYSVLRDLGTQGFQANNNPATLTGIFASIRGRQDVDLSETLTVTPNWDVSPRMVAANVMRMRGVFPIRPAAVAFDLMFAWENGGWRLEAVAIQPASAAPH